MGVGCQPVSVFEYADDICLDSPTAAGLKKLAIALEHYAATHQVKLNPSKSWAMACGSDSPAVITLCGHLVKHCDRIKYLGFSVSERTG